MSDQCNVMFDSIMGAAYFGFAFREVLRNSTEAKNAANDLLEELQKDEFLAKKVFSDCDVSADASTLFDNLCSVGMYGFVFCGVLRKSPKACAAAATLIRELRKSNIIASKKCLGECTQAEIAVS